MSPRFLLPMVCCAVCVSGCALWNREEPSEPPSLPAAKMAQDTVVLEIAFARASGAGIAQQEGLWRQIDEQPLAAPLRRRMHENGLRAGVVSSQMPDELRKLLEQNHNPLAITGAGTPEDVTASQRQLQSRAGKRGVILTGGAVERMTLLLQEDGNLIGEEFKQAQCLFAVKTFPQGDGRVRVELTPEIEHGDARQRWIGQEGAFHVEASKDRKVIETLKLELVLSPGEVLAVSCTPDQKGLGKQFFAPAAGGEQKLLLIRVSQTQYDDVFAPEKVKIPLTTVD